jgi:F-type H+-transporting ATPase subunit c
MEETTQHLAEAGLQYKYLAKGIAIALAGGAPAIAIGILASKAMQAIGRNPEAAPKIQTAMIIAAALAEGIAVIGLLFAFIF